jgi:hypothetical protein
MNQSDNFFEKKQFPSPPGTIQPGQEIVQSELLRKNRPFRQNRRGKKRNVPLPVREDLEDPFPLLFFAYVHIVHGHYVSLDPLHQLHLPLGFHLVIAREAEVLTPVYCNLPRFDSLTTLMAPRIFSFLGGVERGFRSPHATEDVTGPAGRERAPAPSIFCAVRSPVRGRPVRLIPGFQTRVRFRVTG